MTPPLARVLATILLFAGGTASAAAADTYSLTTVAGAPAFGYQDGAAINARFGLLGGIASDSSGNMYVADPYNHTIRRISGNGGSVSTFAGTPGRSGFLDGVGSAAAFSAPQDVAVDAAGFVYVADRANHAIRRITPEGVVTTLAGNGSSGGADGVASAARFLRPTGLCVDAAGIVYVADSGNNTIRRITATGVVTTVAGTAGASGSLDGIGAGARFLKPWDVAVDSAGVLYVIDSDNNTVRKIAADGAVSTFAGTPSAGGFANGVGNAARFNDADSIVVDQSGNVYVTDTGNHILRRITPAGVVTTAAGTQGSLGYADATGLSAVFYFPTGLALNPANGLLYLNDAFTGTIRRFNPTSGDVGTVAGRSPLGGADGIGFVARFFGPADIAFDSGGMAYVVDSENHTIRRITPAGVVSTYAGGHLTRGSDDGSGTAARFARPKGIAVDASDNLIIADYDNGTVRRITPAGVVSTHAGAARQYGTADGTLTAARFDFPWGVAIDPSGNIFISDIAQDTVRKITPGGIVTTIAGLAGATGNADGPGASARFNSPAGLVSDSAGNIYVADFGNETIRKIAPDGTVSTYAGLAGSAGSDDGIGSAARFNGPMGLAIDAAGALYVADRDNFLIRRIGTDRDVTTIAGYRGGFGSDDGLALDGRLAAPTGLKFDRHGNLYIADYSGRTVRKLGAITETPASWISNLSVRADMIPGQTLIAGLVTRGSKPVVIRGIGPGLQAVIPNSILAGNPALGVYSGPNLVASNDDWGGGSALSSEFSRLGAFALPAASLDAALSRDISGAHTVHMSAQSAGVGLFEAYDGSVGGTSRLVNVSARYRASSGAGTLIAGFVVAGTGQKTILVRGVGPSLTQLGVTGEMSDPLVEVYNSAGVRVAESNEWSTSLAGVMASVGAFAMPLGSKDGAVLVTVAAGSSYTALVSGFGGSVGEALVEVYEVGN